jgi:hypothetical protein
MGAGRKNNWRCLSEVWSPIFLISSPRSSLPAPISPIITDRCYPSIETLFYYLKTMSDLDRGIMKFKGADSPLAIVISSVLVLGGITILILWAMQHAYAV